ncbi:DUF3383 family protein [Lacrimispora sp.]|jgi:hypothetical protein|uniref:DUF3383 family protein n=1 Tax=Lacrimispora sp. TaxID=2719234 RepID=UPI0028AFF3A5|nr:DUF3383 family protein [Lacrimispora sp.]
MSKDIVVVVSLEDRTSAADALDILLVSTAGVKPAKTYTSLADIEKDWTKASDIYLKAAAMFYQGKAIPTPASLIRKVTTVGFATPESPEALVAALVAFQQINNDWYLFLTDKSDDAYVKALGKFAEESEPSEAELTAGLEDHRKLYFAQTTNKAYASKNARTIVIYTEDLEEQADAAWVGAVGPWYPQSVTWKFKLPAGLSAPTLSESEIIALETNNMNYVTSEYKKNYIKNGTCMDGEWIDAVIGADWIALTMRSKLYDIFMSNANIPYTDAGFAVVAAGIFETLNEAAGYSIIAENPESGAGIYMVSVPKRSEASEEQASARVMPDIKWEAQLGGAVHGVKVSGILKATLS